MKDQKEKERLLMDANYAKDRLYEIACKLEEEGFIRKAKSCMTLVYAIEEWQRRN